MAVGVDASAVLVGPFLFLKHVAAGAQGQGQGQGRKAARRLVLLASGKRTPTSQLQVVFFSAWKR